MVRREQGAVQGMKIQEFPTATHCCLVSSIFTICLWIYSSLSTVTVLNMHFTTPSRSLTVFQNNGKFSQFYKGDKYFTDFFFLLILLFAPMGEKKKTTIKEPFGWKLALITNSALGCALTHVISVVELPLFHAWSRKKKPT